MKEFKPIPGHPLYAVTRDGRVWSFWRSRWLKGMTHPDGRTFIWLWSSENSGARVRRSVSLHRTVWTAFKGPIPKGFEIDHIDRDRTNNKLSNLRLVTSSQNKLNVGMRQNNTSGFKGVSQHKSHARRGWASWFGRVKLTGRVYQTSYFYTPDAAAAALRELRERVCGEFSYHE